MLTFENKRSYGYAQYAASDEKDDRNAREMIFVVPDEYENTSSGAWICG